MGMGMKRVEWVTVERTSYVAEVEDGEVSVLASMGKYETADHWVGTPTLISREVTGITDVEEACECDDGLVPGALLGCGSTPGAPIGIEKCDLCNRFDDDLDAAVAAAELVGGVVRFYDADASGGLKDGYDEPEGGVIVRTWPRDKDVVMMAESQPWVTVDGIAWDWDRYRKDRGL